MSAADFTRAGSPITATGFNNNVAATRAATINGANGAMFDRNPMGDTTFFVTKQPRQIRDKKESLYFPFTLRVVNVGTAANPTYRKLFYFPDHACDVDDGWAECDNASYSGQEKWAQDGKWFYIADSTGDEQTSRTLDQNKIEYVYLHVLSSYDAQGAMRSAIVTNSKLIPEDFNGMRTDCICIGHFSVPTSSEIGNGVKPKVLEQFVQGQVQVYGGRSPLQLSVVNIGTEASPEWVKCFYFTNCCVYFDGDIYADCINTPYPGYAAGGEGIYLISNASGTATPLQESVQYAFLHVKKVSSNRVEMIVTNDDETIPTAWEEEEDYCCCIGRFSTPTQAEVLQGNNPFVEEQFIRSQVQIVPNTTDFPFEIRQINTGTEESPSYTTIVNVPSGAIKCCYPTYPDENLEVYEGNWYKYSGDTSRIGLKVFLSFKKQAEGEEPVINPARCYWTLGDWGSSYMPEGVQYTYKHDYNYPLGFVRADHTCYNLARSAITIPADFLAAASYGLGGGGGGGGGGSFVTVTDSRGLTQQPGVMGFLGGVGSQASPYQFQVKDGIGPDLVFFDTTAGAEKTLIDYLSGDYEVEIGGQNLGANVNTEVFGELCLGPTMTPDIDDETPDPQDYAAPSAHVHTLSQLVNEEGAPLEGDDILGWFDDLGITGDITGEGNLLTDADIQTDASVYKKDGTASAGSYSGGLSLADHVHPLNAGTAHTEYAYGDHGHGNITNDGKMSGTPKGVLLNTDATTGAIIAGPTIVPAGWSEVFESDLELIAGMSECYGLYDAGGTTGYVARIDLTKIYSTFTGCLVNVGENGLLGAADSIRGETHTEYDTDVELLSDMSALFATVPNVGLRIPTSSLTCDVDEHSGNCLLVAEDTVVTHSGNDMYNAVEALTEDYVANENVIPYVKKDSLTANSYVKTDGSSNFTTVSAIPTADVDYGEGVENLTSECFGTGEGDVAEGNHYHGNISALGVLTCLDDGATVACAEGKLLVTGTNGVIEQNGPSWTPAGISATDYEILESLVSIFDYAQESGVITPTLSTTHLKYPSGAGHTGDCLLVVGDDGLVTHSGNDMFNAADALTTDYTENNNTIPYWKVDTSGTGVVYNTAGTISYKPLDAANGVAGLDANGKIAASRLPSYTSGKWMKTDGSGNIGVTNEVPLAIDAAKTGVFYNTSGVVSYKSLGTSSGTIAEGNHTHGNITTDGKITGTPKGVLLFTDGTSGAITTSSSLIPAGWDFDNDVELLDAIVGNFTKTTTNEIKIPTSSLTCDVAQHSGNCILVAKGTEVTHSGNDMYNAADALTTDYKVGNKIPYWKVATDQTGVVYDANGTISYKPLDAANGIAGLDANGKVAASRLPTYTASKWMKTDWSGNIGTTNEVPLMVSASTGVFYNTNGTVSYKSLGTTSGTIANGDHVHGNITTDGKITGAAGRLMITDASSNIAASSGICPSGWGYSSDIALLADIVALFSKPTAGVRLPTSSLTCDVSGHQNKCLLIADGADVTHSGNRMYNMLDAATDSDKAASKIITDKDLGSGLEFTSSNVLAVKTKDGGGISATADGIAVGGFMANQWCKTDASGNLATTSDTPIVASTSATGVVYNTTGVISYKPINAANGVAGLDANSKLAFAQIPTGNSAATVAVGNHGHSDIISFPGFSLTAPGKDTASGTVGSATTAAHGDHTHPINVDTTAPAAAGGTAAVGTATTYARRDHVHAVKFATSAAAGQLVYVKDTSGTAGNHTTALYTGKTDIEVLAALGGAMSGITDGKATFSASSISDPNCTSGGDCLAYFDENKKLAHLGTTGITKSRLNAINASFDYTGQEKAWTDASLKHDKIKYSGATALTAPKVLGFAKDTAQHGSVSLMDVALLAPKSGDTGASADNAPIADLWVGSSETAASKIGRIGTSSYAARADHKHCLETGTGSAVDPSWPSEGVLPTEALDQTTWEPGGTNGLKEAHCTRIIQQGNYRFLIFRNYTYSKNGNLIYRGPEYAGARARYA